MSQVRSALTAGLVLALIVRGASQDVYSEEALVTWLTPQRIMVHLRFDQATTASRHHTSFPHAIQHLATSLPLHSVELALTSGRWRHSEWGTPVVPVKPAGAVLDAAFHAGLDVATLDARWSSLVHALSGLSCASLGLLREPSSVAGGRTRLQDLRNGSEPDNRRLHAMLPHEALCTENLTPWLRLLPCRDQAGLASLLGHRPTIFGAEYVSLGLLVDRGASARGPRGVRLVLTCTLVLQLPAPLIAAHQQQQRQQQQQQQPVDLEELLGARVEHFCPAALRSQVYVVVQPAAAGQAAQARGGSCPWTGDSDGAATLGGSCPSRAGQGMSLEAEVAGDGNAGGHGFGGGASPGSQDVGTEVGSLLAPVAREAGSRQTGAPAAVPYLRSYGTLDLLESNGSGFRLKLPPLVSAQTPPPPPPPQQQQQQQQHAEDTRARSATNGAGSSVGAAAEQGALAGSGSAAVTTERYVTGAGLLRGGMVLAVRRSQDLLARLGLAATCGSSGGGDGGGGGGHGAILESTVDAARGGGGAEAATQPVAAVCLAHVVCVHQVFPWYVRPWVHTLELLYDGEVVPLLPRLVSRRVQPAVARFSPGVLDLCLHVPPPVSELQLRLAFSKAFLTAFEYPPDAHRGFDVPAATVSYVDPLHAQAVEWRVARSGPESHGGGGAAEEEDAVSSPLLGTLPGGAVREVHTPGLLVPLAAPDFSMPYNVICLSSTLLAVYFGAVLNLLTRRGSDREALGEGDGPGGEKRRRAVARRKAAQMVALVLLFAGLALYLDAELREQVEGMLSALGLPVGANTTACGASGAEPDCAGPVQRG